jgi:palmitoyl transferase
MAEPVKHFLAWTLVVLGTGLGCGAVHAACDDTGSAMDETCRRFAKTWEQGTNDYYLPFHTYHLRYAYTQEKISSYRENTWGLGYGKNYYSNDGTWDGLYGMVFMDSHSRPEVLAGYGHQWMWGPRTGWHAGLGYTVFLTARSDIWHYLPVPGVLPIASINYAKLSVNAAFVPGTKGNGNVLFLWSRFGL